MVEEKENKEKNKGGRPKKEIDYKLVSKLAKIFCTQSEIAVILDLSESTLKHNEQFLHVYKKGLESAKSSLRRNQFKLSKTNPAMAIFLGKNYLGQRDKQEFEHTVINSEQAKAEISQIFEQPKVE